VQGRLAALGLAVSDVPGRYGPSTRAAVRRFQQQRLLAADGVVATDTWAALVDAGFRFGDRLLYETRPSLRGDDVLELQQRLARLGFDAGPPDGILGSVTAAALRDFQHNCGIAVDGIVGPATVSRLDSLHRDHQAAMGFDVLDRVSSPVAQQLAGARVLLDPAHGPLAPGVRVDGAVEADVVLDIANRAAGHLLALGAVPLLSRGATTTPSTEERAAFANAADLDVIVSLRCAGLDHPAARGVAAYYFGSERGHSEQGRRLAGHLVRGLSSSLDTPNCRIHASTTTVLRESRPPAVVVEVGYLTNPVEGSSLATPAYRQRVAQALVIGLEDWFGGSPTVDETPLAPELTRVT
jgi:N-acetylmuramoyl-L-alanine amidase